MKTKIKMVAKALDMMNKQGWKMKLTMIEPRPASVP